MNLASSKADLQLVVKEMREGTNVKNICLIGIRYGSFLTLKSLKDIKADSLILWNPIFSGKDYIEEISFNEKEFFQGSFAVAKKNSGFECMGFIYNNELIKSLMEFNLKSFHENPIDNILILADNEFLEKYNIADYDFLGKSNLKLIRNSVSRFWLKHKGEQDKSIVPIKEIKKITEWLEGLK